MKSIRYHYRLENRKVLLFLGRISREKRILTIVRYMKKKLKNDPSLAVMIVGSGLYSAHIHKWAKSHKLIDSIILTGSVMNKDTADYYHLANVFLSGSKMETHAQGHVQWG